MLFRTKYNLVKYSGLAVSVVAYALLAYGVFLFILAVVDIVAVAGEYNFNELVRRFRELIPRPLAVVLVSLIVNQVGFFVRREADSMKREFEKSLLGAIEAYQHIPLSYLAQKIGEDPRYIEYMLTRLKIEGRFRGFIDLQGYVHARLESPVPAIRQVQPQRVQQGTGRVPSGEQVEERELVDVEEKRREIEEMYKRGIISRETYLRLLEELEKTRQS